MEVLESTRQYSWLEDSLRKRGLIMKTHFPQYQRNFHYNYHGTCFHGEMELTPNGCKDNLP